MQVVWQTFLEAINPGVVPAPAGAPQHCPIHTHNSTINTRTMSVTLNPVTGEPYFVCHHARCRFRGTAVTVVQRLHNLRNFEDAVAYFKPGGLYAHTLPPNIPPEYLADYIKNNDSEVRVTHFLGRCQSDLAHNSDAAVALRVALDDLGCTIIPSDLGVLRRTHRRGVNADTDIPEAFALRLTDTDYILYPYTYNRRLNSLRFQKVFTLKDWCVPETHLLTPHDAGVFMEDNIRNTTTDAYIVTTALGACLVNAKCQTHTLKSLPIVSVTGFPLPPTFDHVKRITIITFNQSPLDLGVALELYNNTVLEDGTDRPVRVIDLNLDYTQIPSDLYTRLEAREYHSLALDEWLIHRLRRLESRGSVETITKVFNRINLTDHKRDTLLAKARALGLSSNILNIIATGTGTAAYDKLILANQRVLCLTESGLKALQPNGEEEMLCNFRIAVDAKTQLDKSRLGYKCTITLDNRSFTVGLTDRELKSAETLRSAITAAMTALGITGYIAAYKVKHYDWRDILCKLGQDVPCDIST